MADGSGGGYLQQLAIGIVQPRCGQQHVRLWAPVRGHAQAAAGAWGRMGKPAGAGEQGCAAARVQVCRLQRQAPAARPILERIRCQCSGKAGQPPLLPSPPDLTGGASCRHGAFPAARRRHGAAAAARRRRHPAGRVAEQAANYVHICEQSFCLLRGLQEAPAAALSPNQLLTSGSAASKARSVSWAE